MKTIKTFASSEKFLSTFLKLTKQVNDPHKIVGICMQCNSCKSPIRINEVFKLDKTLDKGIDLIIDERVRNSILDHYKQNQQCASSSVYIDPLIGTPKQIIFSCPVPGTDMQFISDFTFAGDWYVASIKVMPMESNRNVIFVLYEKSNDRPFSKIIIQNLDILESRLDDCGEKLEVWQMPIVKSIADVMISQQEQETMLADNMKRMEDLILKDIDIGEKMGSNQEVNENVYSNNEFEIINEQVSPG